MNYVDLNGNRVSAPQVYATEIGEFKLIELVNGRILLAGEDSTRYSIVDEKEIAAALRGILSRHLDLMPNTLDA